MGKRLRLTQQRRIDRGISGIGNQIDRDTLNVCSMRYEIIRLLWTYFARG
jgi:hypothetical protein